MVDKITGAITPIEEVEKINEIIDNLGGYSIFDFKWADHLLNDQSWLRSNGSWHSGTAYSDAYNHLVQDIQGINAKTETVGNYTITFYRASDGHKIVIYDEQDTTAYEAYLDILNATGIAWYYLLDTTNVRFTLPETMWGFKGIRTRNGNVGDKVDETLPNITGAVATVTGNTTSTSGSGAGALKETHSKAANWTAGSSSGNWGGAAFQEITFDASRSSSAYQTNASVQEKATQMYLYFYVGKFSQTATEQTAGLNSELFNGKADVDLSNINASQSAKETITAWGVADYSASVSMTSPYTCPKNGFIFVGGNSGTAQSWSITRNGTVITMPVFSTYSTDGIEVLFPVLKNDVITAVNTYPFIFYPMKGV